MRSLAGGEEALTQLSPPDGSVSTVDNGRPKIAPIKGDFADVFSERLPKGLSPQHAIEHAIDLVPRSKPTARPSYKICFAEQAEMNTQLANLLAILLGQGHSRKHSKPFQTPRTCSKRR